MKNLTNITILKSAIIIFVLIFIFSSCEKDDNELINDNSVLTVATEAANSITYNTAILNGKVNANETNATVYFEYGQTTDYGETINATPSSVTGTSETQVSASLTNLTDNTTYHFCIVAENEKGVTKGNDMIFTTNEIPIPEAPSNLKKGDIYYQYISGYLMGVKTKLSWSSSSNFTGYYYIHIKRNDNEYSIDSTMNLEKEVKVWKSQSGIIFQFDFIVTAKNESGESEPSNEISISF